MTQQKQSVVLKPQRLPASIALTCCSGTRLLLYKHGRNDAHAGWSGDHCMIAHVHDGLLAVLGPEEVEQVLAVHLDPLQRLARDLRSACWRKTPSCLRLWCQHKNHAKRNTKAPLTVSEAAVWRGRDKVLSQHELPVSVRHAMALMAFHLSCTGTCAFSMCLLRLIPEPGRTPVAFGSGQRVDARTILICSCCALSRGGRDTSSGLKLWSKLPRRRGTTVLIIHDASACCLPSRCAGTCSRTGQVGCNVSVRGADLCKLVVNMHRFVERLDRDADDVAPFQRWL